MTLVFLQYENRSKPVLIQLMAQNKAYCEKHNYVYIFNDAVYDMPPYWIKVYLIRNLMKSTHADYVCWLDSDAVVHDTNRRIESLFDSGDFLISYDEGDWNDGLRIVNAGVFLIKNTPATQTLMDDWMKCYNPAKWEKIESESESQSQSQSQSKWICKGRWAGPDYEQGALNERVLTKHSNTINILPPAVLCSRSASPPAETFACHFYGNNKLKSVSPYLVFQRIPELILWICLGASAVYLSRSHS